MYLLQLMYTTNPQKNTNSMKVQINDKNEINSIVTDGFIFVDMIKEAHICHKFPQLSHPLISVDQL